MLEVLKQKGVTATFFLQGDHAARHPDLVKRIRDEGHVIGNHSYTHRFHTYLLPGRFDREVAHTQTVLTDLLGRTPALVRTPWLWRTPGVLRSLRRQRLQPVAGVFAHAAEVFQPDAARLARRAIAKARPGAILIFHDGFDGRGGDRAQTARATELTVDALIRRGYRFVTVDELLGVEAYRSG